MCFFVCVGADRKHIQKKFTIVVKLRRTSRKHRIFHFSSYFQHKNITSLFHSIQFVRMNMESSDLFSKIWFDEWKKWNESEKGKKWNEMKKMMTALRILLCELIMVLLWPYYYYIFFYPCFFVHFTSNIAPKIKIEEKCYFLNFLAKGLSPETVELYSGTVP